MYRKTIVLVPFLYIITENIIITQNEFESLYCFQEFQSSCVEFYKKIMNMQIYILKHHF